MLLPGPGRKGAPAAAVAAAVCCCRVAATRQHTLSRAARSSEGCPHTGLSAVCQTSLCVCLQLGSGDSPRLSPPHFCCSCLLLRWLCRIEVVLLTICAFNWGLHRERHLFGIFSSWSNMAGCRTFTFQLLTTTIVRSLLFIYFYIKQGGNALTAPAQSHPRLQQAQLFVPAL